MMQQKKCSFYHDTRFTLHNLAIPFKMSVLPTTPCIFSMLLKQMSPGICNAFELKESKKEQSGNKCNSTTAQKTR